MTTEFVLLLGLYAFILLGAFLGNKGPVATIRDAGPRLGAKVEKNIAIGNQFKKPGGQPLATWTNPEE